MRHVLKLLAIIIVVFFAGYIFNSLIEESPIFTIPVRESIDIISDFFPVFVSFSIFSVIWFAYGKSRDNHSLFMGMIFLVTGLIDLCHTLSYPFMPDFITPNSLEKVAVLQGEARLISAILFVVSAYVYRDTFPELINKPVMFISAIILFLISIIPALLYTNQLPLLYSGDSRSFTLIIRQIITTAFMLYASYLYTKRIQETGQRHLIPLVYGFIILIFSDLIYFEYEISGHLLKLTAFLFMYIALYKSSVELPYEKLAVAEQKLRQAAEEKYRSLVQTASDAIISEDSNGNIISWNKGAQKIFGYTEEEVLGRSLIILMPERYREDHRRGFERYKLTGKSKYIGKTLEFYGLRRDGTEFPLELSVTIWKTESEAFYTGIIRDITERKRAEEALRKSYDELEKRVQERTAELAKANKELQIEIAERKRVERALRESESKYRSIFENAAEGIYKSTPDGSFLEVNPSLARMLGYGSPQELMSEFTNIRKLFVEKGRLEEFIYLMQTHGTVVGFENQLHRKDGSTIWALMNTRALRDSSGKITGFEGMIVDITERKRTEQRLRLFSEAVEEAADGIQIIGLDGRIIFSNKAAEAIYGFFPDEFKGKHVDDLNVDPEFASKVVLPSIRETGRWVGELMVKHKSGRVFPILLTASMVKDSKGEPIAMVGIIRDITERKRAEEEREQLIAELARSNAELEQFAYIASHDLQEPLRMISGFTQLLERRYKGKLDKNADEFIAYIVDGAARMQRMIEDLLAYSRVGTRGKPFEPTNLEDVFNQAVTNLKVAIEQSGAQVTHDPLPTVLADASQMVQLFQNLIGNAIKFRRDEPLRVHVSAKREGNEWIFSVQDNGIGIAPEFMGRLFQLFAREHTADEYPGTGIGLAICRRIVERHGGRIWAESEVGRGTTFYFTIPVRKSERQ